jgi:hypothetical protein
MVVEAVYHHEAGNVVSARQVDGGFELVLQILGHLLSVNPKLHALGDPVQGIAGSGSARIQFQRFGSIK